MTREQIKSAASEAALRMKFRSDIHPSQQGEALFIEGAEWRINFVWHDAIERPKQGEHIVVLMENGSFTSWFVTQDIMEVFKKFNVVLWARSSDLLPERKEETK